MPALEYYFAAEGNNKSKMKLHFRWIDCVKGFNMPIKVQLGKDKAVWIKPEDQEWKSISTDVASKDELPNIVNRNFYVRWVKKP